MMNMVVNQDLEGLKGLIANGADINAQGDMQGMIALNMACAYSYMDIVENLVSEGADVNIQDTMYGHGRKQYRDGGPVERERGNTIISFLDQSKSAVHSL